MDDGITISAGGTMFCGPDAIRLYRAVAVRSALKLAKAGIKINRYTTTTDLFKIATEYSGKAYKRGQYDQAMADVTIWIDVMRSAIPIVVEDRHQVFPITVDGKEMFQ